MKKLVWFLLIMPLLFVACSKDDTDPLEICQQAMQQLCPEVLDVNWHKEDKYYVAEFEYQPAKASMEVWFETTGQWIMKAYDYGNNLVDTPSTIIDFLNNKVSTYTVVNVWKYEHSNGDCFWNVAVKLSNGEIAYRSGDAKSPDSRGAVNNKRVTPDSSAWRQGQWNVHPH